MNRRTDFIYIVCVLAIAMPCMAEDRSSPTPDDPCTIFSTDYTYADLSTCIEECVTYSNQEKDCPVLGGKELKPNETKLKQCITHRCISEATTEVLSDAVGKRSITKLENKLKNLEAANANAMSSPLIQDLKGALAEIRRFEKKQNEFTGTVKLALNSDDSTNNESYNIRGGFSVDKGSYPNQFRASVNIAVDDNDGGFSEELSTLRVSFDRYKDVFGHSSPTKVRSRTPLYEFFTFGERFTDKFMSIDQRYELGVGLKLEWNAAPALPWDQHRKASPRQRLVNSLSFLDTNQIDNLRKTAQIIDAHGKDVKPTCSSHNDSTDCTNDTLDALKAVGAYISNNESLRNGLLRQTSLFEVGVSAALLGEFERASVEIVSQADENGDARRSSISIPSRRTTRLSIRPSFLVNLSEDLSLLGSFYWKPSVDEVKFSGSDDLREEIHVDLNYKVKSTIVTLSYKKFFDNDPPTPSCSQIIDAAQFAMDFPTEAACQAGRGGLAVDRGAFRHEVIFLDVSFPIK